MLQLALLKFSPRMASLGVLCVLLLPLCLICWRLFLSVSAPLAGMSLKIQNSAFHIAPSVFTTRRHIPRARLDDLLIQVIQKKQWSSLDLPNRDPFCNYRLIISSYDPWHPKGPNSKPKLNCSSALQSLPIPYTRPSLLYGKITSQPLTMTSLHLLLCYSKHMWLLHKLYLSFSGHGTHSRTYATLLLLPQINNRIHHKLSRAWKFHLNQARAWQPPHMTCWLTFPNPSPFTCLPSHLDAASLLSANLCFSPPHYPVQNPDPCSASPMASASLP